jgi:membrane-bound ClpP family serine protease
MGPNTAFCLVIFGLFAIEYEFIRPGSVLPGICGAGAAVTGGYFLWRAAPSAIGLEMLAGAAAFFVLDAFVNTYYIAGMAATIALAAGFVRLIEGARGIRPFLAVPWCVAFGVVTTGLNWAGRRARRNKRSG